MITHISKIGHNHSQNEDAFSFWENQDYCVFGVMDGCGGAVDSVFSAHLLKKIFNLFFSLGFVPNDEGEDFLKQINIFAWDNLTKIGKGMLMLPKNQLESTFLVLLINKHTHKYWCSMVGDGCLVIDGALVYNDQNGIPHYMCHYEGIEEFLENIYVYEGVFGSQIALCSDGLLSWKHYERNEKVSVIEYFLNNNRFLGINKLNRTFSVITKGHNVDKMLNHDDFTILNFEDDQL